MLNVMPGSAQQEKLPRLREELRILPSGILADGGRGWLIFDPIRNSHFQANQLTVDVLSLWKSDTIQRLVSEFYKTYGVPIDGTQIVEIIRFLHINNLTENNIKGQSKYYLEQAHLINHSWYKWLMEHYLFFRIPLVRPDKFLRKTYKFVAPFLTVTFAWIIIWCTGLGLYLASRQWDTFSLTFNSLFSIQGLMLYGFSMLIVKSLHELGHAYFAVKNGCRVPVMGVAFLFMFPVLYTDVSDVWRLADKKQRLMIGAAGVIVELSLAGIATLIWVFLPDGLLRNMVFTIAATSWIISLIININPFMRFDGYYFTMDLVNISNLQPRSFALTKWKIREILFDFGEDMPESIIREKRRFMYIYAVSVWIYRFFLFLGIALLIYYYVVRPIGPVLFVIEIYWLIARPIINELVVWGKNSKRIFSSFRSYITLSVLALVIFALVYPWHTTIKIPAILAAKYQSRIFAPFPAQIKKIAVKYQQVVEAGDILFILESTDLLGDEQKTKYRIELINARINRFSTDIQDRSQRTVLLRQLAEEKSYLSGLRETEELLTVKTPLSGVVGEIDHNLTKGRWLSTKEQLALIINNRGLDVRGLIASDDLGKIQLGSIGYFIPNDPSQSRIKVILKEISAIGVEQITSPYLVEAYGGAIPVADTTKQNLRPVAAQYPIVAEPTKQNNPPKKVVVGVLLLTGKGQSIIARIYAQMVKVLIRELSI